MAQLAHPLKHAVRSRAGSSSPVFTSLGTQYQGQLYCFPRQDAVPSLSNAAGGKVCMWEGQLFLSHATAGQTDICALANRVSSSVLPKRGEGPTLQSAAASEGQDHLSHSCDLRRNFPPAVGGME